MPVVFESQGGIANIGSGRTETFTGLPDNAFVVWVVGVENDTTISLPSGWTGMSSDGAGTGTGRTMKRLFDGAASNGSVTFGNSTEHFSAWCAYTGVLSSEHSAGGFPDPPNLVASRVMTSKDMWVGFGAARRSGVTTPPGYTARVGSAAFNLATRIIEKVGQDSDTENPGAIFTGSDNGFESIGTLALLAKPLGGGFGSTMAPRMAMESLEKTPREEIWIPKLKLPRERRLLPPKPAFA